MSELLTLAAYWHSRKESVDECASRLERYFAGLVSLSPLFESMYYSTSRRSEGDKLARTSTHDDFVRHLLRGVHKEDGVVFEELGYQVSFLSALPKKQHLIVRCACGNYADRVDIINNVIMEFSSDIDDITATEKMKALLLLHSRCWDAPWVTLFRDEDISRVVGPFSEKHPLIGKMAYLDASIGLPPGISQKARVEKIDGGHFIYAE